MAAAQAESIVVRKDWVIPIRFDRDVHLRDTRAGDRVWARVDDDRDLPFGTWFDGRVKRVQRPRTGRPGYVEIEFVALELPDRTRREIRALPVTLDSRYVRRDGDGRFYVSRKQTRPEKHVFGGMLGGLILGSMIDKPFEGAFVGTLAGIIVAETERVDAENETVIRRGRQMGALFERDFRFRYDGPWPRARDFDTRRGTYDDGWDRERRDEMDRFPPDYRDRGERRDERAPGVRLDDLELRYDVREQPYWEGKTCMVPLAATCRQASLGISRSEDRDRFYVEGPEGVLVIEQNSGTYRLNGRRVELPERAIQREGVVYVPVDAIARVAGKTAHVDGTRGER
jgi:hypothetical protein